MCSAESNPGNSVLIKAYLDHLRLERRCSPNSVIAAQRDLSLLDMPFTNMSAQHLKTILAKRHANGAAASSLARLASSWRGFFGFLVDNGHVATNPCLGLKTPKLPRALPKAVGVDPLAALLDQPLPQAFRMAQAHVLIELLYCTGLRISEALSLHAVNVVNSREIQVIGKGNKSRVVPLVDSLQMSISQFMSLRDAHLVAAGKPGQPALFVSAKGERLGVRQAQKDTADYAASSGLGQHLHPHMLRHSFGSHVLQGTQNLRAVQELLGHASIASTQVYTALDFEHLSSVYDKAFPRAK